MWGSNNPPDETDKTPFCQFCQPPTSRIRRNGYSVDFIRLLAVRRDGHFLLFTVPPPRQGWGVTAEFPPATSRSPPPPLSRVPQSPGGKALARTAGWLVSEGPVTRPVYRRLSEKPAQEQPHQKCSSVNAHRLQFDALAASGLPIRGTGWLAFQQESILCPCHRQNKIVVFVYP